MGAQVWSTLIVTALLGLFVLARYPEPAAEMLTAVDGWVISGAPNSLTSVASFPEHHRQVRRSVIQSSGALLYRTWTLDKGVAPLQVTSPPFRPERYMSIAITGANRTPEGRVSAFLECEANRGRLELFRGSVNVNVTEALIALPAGWCPGLARLRLDATERHINVGIGAVFSISALSYAKSSFLGRVPFLAMALVAFVAVMFAGASLASRTGWRGDLLVAAFASLGASALAVFYLASALPVQFRWAAAACIAVAVACALVYSGREARKRTAVALAPYARVWIIACLAYFSLLGLATNGLGHWEPNYRFWPAIWSSDNELPWIMAEAIRRGWDLASLFGVWKPTDRPPLMAGADLLVADLFAMLQAGNDGTYLRGQAYNAVSLALNALWVPACWWLLAIFRSSLDVAGRVTILVLVGCLPIVVFNTIYGWPKAFGAAFALLAFGVAWMSCVSSGDDRPRWSSASFFVLGAFSMLAHASTALFLAPVGLFVVLSSIRRSPRTVLAGMSIALVLMASWSAYKAVVLPSAEPVTKYALTGDFGFADPSRSLWTRLAERYGSLSISQWLEIKRIMVVQAFVPQNHAIAPYYLNSDSGAGPIDRLRAWDALLLSRGNVVLPLLALVALVASAWARVRGGTEAARADAPFLAIVGASLAAWVMMVAGFFAPIIVPHWPQAALFGLAFGAAVVVQGRHPRFFACVFFAAVTYAAIVWILSPIKSALDIDAGAAAVLALMASWAVWRAIPMNAKPGILR